MASAHAHDTCRQVVDARVEPGHDGRWFVSSGHNTKHRFRRCRALGHKHAALFTMSNSVQPPFFQGA